MHTQDLIKAMSGLKDAPRAFGMRLRRTLRGSGYKQGITDPQMWCKFAKPITDRAPGPGKGRSTERASGSGAAREPAETERASGPGLAFRSPRKVQYFDGAASVGGLLVCIISTHAPMT